MNVRRVIRGVALVVLLLAGGACAEQRAAGPGVDAGADASATDTASAEVGAPSDLGGAWEADAADARPDDELRPRDDAPRREDTEPVDDVGREEDTGPSSPECGNGVVEPGETCDGDCPESCGDGNDCTLDRLTGSAAGCSAACSFSAISACQEGDGCCPAGCRAGTDGDCPPPGRWVRAVLGTIPHSGTPSGMEVDVGPGRGDDVNRLYVASWEGDVYEWSCAGGEWTMAAVLESRNILVPVTVGAPHDLSARVFTGLAYTSSDQVLAFEWLDGWFGGILDGTLAQVICVRVADGRGDGVHRVHAGAEGAGGLAEYTWNGEGWDKLVIDGGISAGTFDFGDGRNDGTTRLYCPNRATGQLHEYTWNGAGFDLRVLPVPVDHLVMARVGPGRSDGVQRVYVNGVDSHLYELSWTGAGFDVRDLLPDGPGRSRFSARVARLRGDGRDRLYITARDGPMVAEYEWNGASYSATPLPVDGVTGATPGGLSVGDARNDGVPRLYVSDYLSGAVYEFTWSLWAE